VRRRPIATPFEISFDGATLRGEADGFGIPVVFLHAGVADRRMWDAQMLSVAEAGYHVISYDRRGHGETETPDEPFSHLIDLEAVLDQLDIHAAIFIGCSLGGGLALDFAIENPGRTIGLVLIGTSVTGWESDDEQPEEVEELEEALEYARERGDLELVNRMEAHMWLDGPTSESGRVEGPARELFFAMNDIVLHHPPLTEEEEREPAIDSLSTVTAPVLLICGELDMPYIIERHEVLSELFDSAFAVMLEDTAHLPGLERPDLVDPLLIEFLDTVTGVAPPELPED
jgi:pimeloyl-ACP methyl ester carboxylesterase